MSLQNSVLLSLEYTRLVNSIYNPVFETNNNLWRVQNYSLGAAKRLAATKVCDNLQPLRQVVNKLNFSARTNEDHVQLVEPVQDDLLITFSINGSAEFITAGRTELLTNYNQVSFKKVVLEHDDFNRINDTFIAKLNELSVFLSVEIIIHNVDTDFKNSFCSSDNYNIYIVGNQDNITLAESQVRVLIDTTINSCLLDSVDIPLSLVPIIGGIDLLNFNEVVKQLASNIYLPDLLPELFNSRLISNTSSLKIWITSTNIYEIVLTKRLLGDLIESITKKSNTLVCKPTSLNKAKLDLMLLYNQLDILDVMFKCGTFIQLPSLGETNHTIQVQGQTLDAVNETIRELNLLSANYYRFEMVPTGNVFVSSIINDYYFLNSLQTKRTCMVSYNSFGIHVVGNKDEVKLLIKEMTAYQSAKLLESFQINLVLEINNSQKDFISGKKNGKIIKILNQINQIPTISFQPFNETNFFIKVSVGTGNDRFAFLNKAIELLELELPAELQFNIPEVFHKSIIGNGGNIIQSIMKKYNVFIKFSSSVKKPESSDTIFYSFKRFNNVLIKCPMKNASNIMLVKYEIDQLVTQCCLNNQPVKSNNNTIYHTVQFTLLKSHYLMLMNKEYNLKFINELETECNSFVDFPKSISEFGSSNKLTVSIKGSELRSKQCAAKLAATLPNNYEFRIAFNPGKFGELAGKSQEFKENVIIPFKLMLGVELIVNERCVTGSDNSHQIVMSYFGCEKDEKVQMAINDLTTYLKEKNFLITSQQNMQFDPLAQFQTVLKPISRNQAIRSKANNQSLPQAVPIPQTLLMTQPCIAGINAFSSQMYVL